MDMRAASDCTRAMIMAACAAQVPMDKMTSRLRIDEST